MPLAAENQPIPAPPYRLRDARQQPALYHALFCEYCKALTEDDPSMAQYDPHELAEENLSSRLDHPYLIEQAGEAVGLVVFMDEEAPEGGCHSYIGELFIRESSRRQGLAGRIAQDYLASQRQDVGLCYVRGSAAERFWLNLMARLGYQYRIFEEDSVRDFLYIRLRQTAAEASSAAPDGAE